MLPVLVGVLVVSLAKEYRAYAAECMDWAKNTKSDVDRDRFLTMASAWLRAAAISEMVDTEKTRKSEKERERARESEKEPV